ncbi:MAG: helix-turn-helix transcriptional regulator [Erysipelotrichaceae bacterium]|nr:helix-turn-helix transcriptional regulator [Erysipelotrichaceae bacterium]
MSVLFSLTLRRYENTAVIPSNSTVQWKKQFSGIFTYIQKNYDHATIEDVADACSYSTKQISRIIRNHFQMSYKEFVTFLRMEKALALLKEETLNMEEISKTLGYGDISSFYRAFKKYYKDTPLHYQKNSDEV